ncbi:energy transducer TonB [Amphritea japonica]|uniref:Protein TonB n=1 Tax=Amphritea japonica ATCC BAA-1530 TaxID=1278309 RepID=A0A7R6SUG1_9GAMM|nr:energy transducer TonB [Amphritea japonica]BBB27675.1 conserved hypothetical protein [Amphritea japonica ATCC BAA-1530]
MNSLLAALIESRIFLITIFLSGAVHLTLIGSGWLEDKASPALGGQSLAIKVTENRSVATATVEKMLENGPPAIPEVGAHKAEPKTEGAKTEVSKIIPKTSQKPVIKTTQSNTSIQRLSEKSAVSPTAPATTEVLPPPEPRVTRVDDPIVSPKQQAVSAPETIPAAPVYQSNPVFRQPPTPPRYPRLARKRGVEGQVMLRVNIGQDGNAQEVLIEQSSGSELLDRAARKAVQQWQFMPAQAGGIAVASYVRIPVDFVLETR